MSGFHFTTALKNLLGDLPYAPELYWSLRQRGRPVTAKFDLSRLAAALPSWRAQALAARQSYTPPLATPHSPLPTPHSQPGLKHILLFATQRYWLEHITLLALTLAGQGHQVTLAYLPYAEWAKPLNPFDARRQSAYLQSVLQQAGDLLTVLPLLTAPQSALPPALQTAIEGVALRDTQYTLQVEEVSLQSELYQLRLARNTQAAGALLHWLTARAALPQLAIIPNGTILEFGAVYQTARFCGLPVVTYEFGEQRQRLWLAQNAEVMRQDTTSLWLERRDQALDPEQTAQIRQLFAARQRASLWENFARRWQGVPSEGGQKVRAALRLDARPLVLLATNVIGDSLTLGRQVFSDSMTEWLQRTVLYFARRPDVQLVVRIHPGELVTKGPSVADVVRRALPEVPEHIHLILPDAPINTYDLVEIADLGLVYTTTVGMEMAMSGVPVIVVGATHYRAKGFTLDPADWQDYFNLLEQALSDPAAYRPTPAQVDCAWNYAYRFFFEYPHPYPWHLLHFWQDVEEWPLNRLFSPEGLAQFGPTLQLLSGEPPLSTSHSPLPTSHGGLL